MYSFSFICKPETYSKLNSNFLIAQGELKLNAWDIVRNYLIVLEIPNYFARNIIHDTHRTFSQMFPI